MSASHSPGSHLATAVNAPGAFGKYQLLRHLARGGMAELHLACARGQSGCERTVVLKRILPALAHDPEYVGMFLDEARIGAALDHPNLVRTYDSGIIDGEPYIALEWLPGENLRTILSALQERRERLPLPLAVQIATGLLSGLHYAHEAVDADGKPLRIVHRDVSPHNVIVTREGGVKLLDFGIARAANRRGRSTLLGIVKGKSGYMSPEQCRSGALDRRSDIFSAGSVLYELITGEKLYRGDDEIEVMRRIVHGPVPSLGLDDARCPEELGRIVRRALCKDPAARYQTALEMVCDLEVWARARQLPLSTQALAEFMGSLFRERDRMVEEGAAIGLPGPEAVISLDEDYIELVDVVGPSQQAAPPQATPRAGGTRPRWHAALTLGGGALLWLVMAAAQRMLAW